MLFVKKNKKFEDLSDIELFNLLKKEKKESPEAFKELYSRYSSRIYAYCRRFIGYKEEAEDIFQDTFKKFYEAAQQEREMTNVYGFIIKIARNLCINSKRNQKRTIEIDDSINISTKSRQDKEEMLDLIKQAIEELPPEYKDVLILREYQGLSYIEIAEMTNLSLGTVKVRIFRAKDKIRTILKPYMEEFSKFS
ncbi:MAG TPA: RNA polymerase sigma factor [Candidatus Kapabacteria bacterium]|nr:RNA polymerase sigma factor [Candidatus Kapabacteria bacterium]